MKTKNKKLMTEKQRTRMRKKTETEEDLRLNRGLKKRLNNK